MELKNYFFWINNIWLSFLLFGNVLFKLVFCTFLCIRQICQKSYHIWLQQTKSLSPTDCNLFFFNILQLIDPVTNINPTPCTWVSDNWMLRILLWCYFINWFAFSLQNFASVFTSDTFLENWSMSSYWNKTNWEKVVLWMIVGRCTNYTSCLKD